MNVFDFITSINSKTYIFDEFNAAEYSETLVNRAFTYFPDTILFAAEAERLRLKGKEHYDFLFYSISKRKRFEKWGKKEDDSVLKMIEDEFYVSRKKAMQIAKVLSEHEIKTIKDKNNDR